MLYPKYIIICQKTSWLCEIQKDKRISGKRMNHVVNVFDVNVSVCVCMLLLVVEGEEEKGA